MACAAPPQPEPAITPSIKTYDKNEWRSKKKLCLKGVFEVVSIHWIDLINYIFKIKKIKIPSLINLSKKGTSYDNSYSTLTLNENQQTKKDVCNQEDKRNIIDAEKRTIERIRMRFDLI